MNNQITLEEILKLVSVGKDANGEWCINNVVVDVKGNVWGDVCGDVEGSVKGNVVGTVWGDVKCGVGGSVKGNVVGNVVGNVNGTIKGREWQFVETPKEKLKRLLEESGNPELLEAFDKMENN